jgi:hypothetical protein
LLFFLLFFLTPPFFAAIVRDNAGPRFEPNSLAIAPGFSHEELQSYLERFKIHAE